MIPQAVVAMLACARLGLVHSVVFGGFAAHELSTRIEDCQPRAIITASCGIEPSHIVHYKPLLDEAIAMSEPKPEFTVLYEREPSRVTLDPSNNEIDWYDFVAGAPSHPCVPVDALDPLYLLYTSGTTGTPKGVVRDNGGHVVALKHAMRNIFNTKPGEVFWAASDIGWVVGHSFTVYGPLLAGATSVLYEGKPVGTPDAGAFWRVIQQHNVKSLFVAPTALRAIRQQDPEADLRHSYDLSSLEGIFMAGERLDPDTYAWAKDHLHVPCTDNWWQTETGWPIASSMVGPDIPESLPTIPGSVCFNNFALFCLCLSISCLSLCLYVSVFSFLVLYCLTMFVHHRYYIPCLHVCSVPNQLPDIK
jgi:propionyl-CoA synthetase